MKQFITLMLLVMVAMISAAQTKIPEAAKDGVISDYSSVYIWGSTADTLTNADTLNYVLRIKTTKTQDFWIKLRNDHISGTAGGKLKTYKSINGIDWEVTAAGDSITVTSLTADEMDSESINLSDLNAAYIKATYIQSGTAKAVPKLFINTKEN